MELDITEFFSNACPRDYSASIAEIGWDAARVTWCAACNDYDDFPLLDTDEKRDAFRDFVNGFGDWTVDEIAAWTDKELNALCLQFIAGDIRQANLDDAMPDWEAYEEGAERGTYAGRISHEDNGRIYFYIGS